MEFVPARILNVTPEEEVLYLVEANLYRTKTPGQRLREADVLERYVGAEALARKRSGLGPDGSGGRGRRKTTGPKGPEVSLTRTRDILAKRVGLGSGKQLERLRLIAEKGPDLLDEIDAGKKTIGGALAELRRAEQLREQAELAAKISPRADCILADCRDVLPTLADGRFAAIIADPPYSISPDGIVHPRAGALDLSSNHGSWDELGESEAQTLISFCTSEFYRLLRPGGALFLFTGDRLLGDWFLALRQNGFVFPRPCVLAWVKQNPPPSVRKGGWRSSLETILYVRKPGQGAFHYLGDSEMLSALPFPLVGSDRLHSAQKPVALLERLIRVSTNPGDEILDCFAGSGSTGEAAIRTGRHALLIEKNETFYAVATDRLNRVSREIQGKSATGGPT